MEEISWRRADSEPFATNTIWPLSRRGCDRPHWCLMSAVSLDDHRLRRRVGRGGPGRRADALPPPRTRRHPEAVGIRSLPTRPWPGGGRDRRAAPAGALPRLRSHPGPAAGARPRPSRPRSSNRCVGLVGKSPLGHVGRPRVTDSTQDGRAPVQDAQGAGVHGKARLLAGAEVAAKRFPVRLSAQSSRDLIPGPVRSTGFPHGYLDCLLSNAPGISGGLDQLFNGCHHAIDSVT